MIWRKKNNKLRKIKRRVDRIIPFRFSSQKDSQTMTQRFLYIACLFGVSGVILGAFGAHVLGKILSEADLKIYQTGVQYQFYHTFAILCTAIVGRYTSKRWTRLAGWLFAVGIVLFSGSLYLLSLSHSFEMEAVRPLVGPVTPIGGLFFIGGWVALLLAATQYRKPRHRSSAP